MPMQNICLILFAFLPLLVTACATPNESAALDLPPDVQLSADAIIARQTSDAARDAANVAQSNAQQAQARAEQYSAQQTAIAQSTRDAASYKATDTALQIAIANVTRQAELDRATATEAARRANIASAETSQARAETRAAVQTQTRRAEEIALLAASQTRVAAYPTQTRVAEQIAQDQAERERAARIAAAQAEWDANVQPVANLFAWTVLPLAVVCGIALVVLLGVWKLFHALEEYITSKSLAVSAPALQQMQIRDANGRPLGFLQLKNGSAIYTPYDHAAASDVYELPAPAAVPLRDMVDRTATEQATAAPDPQVLGGFIHYTSLRAFVTAILQDMDWTQKRWADKTLPRGFVLTKDTTDENGNVVPGGYARVMALLVENNLIINRRKGAAGQWNPHAPLDAEGVMAILYHERERPPLPDARQIPSPTESRAAPAAA